MVVVDDEMRKEEGVVEVVVVVGQGDSGQVGGGRRWKW